MDGRINSITLPKFTKRTTRVSQIVETVDAKELQCPMPLLKAKLALNKLETGQVVEVLATDAGSYKDFHAFAEQTTHELLLAEESNGVYRYLICKGEIPDPERVIRHT